jgi:DNA repair and recombination protein RAD52
MVSFVSPTRDPDESFSFSDDDAFLAQVDLGEGDVGRPIDYDEESGGISAGASTSVSRSDLSVGSDSAKDNMDTGARGSMGPPANVGGRNGPSNANSGQARIQQRQDTNYTSTSNPSSSHARVANQNLTSSSANLHANSASVSNPSTSHLYNQNQNSNAAGPAPRQTDVAASSVTGQQQHRVAQSNLTSNLSFEQSKGGATSSRPIQNQNQAPHPDANMKGNPNVPSKKPVTPSMGGFHFPPGMVCTHLSHSVMAKYCVKCVLYRTLLQLRNILPRNAGQHHRFPLLHSA